MCIKPVDDAKAPLSDVVPIACDHQPPRQARGGGPAVAGASAENYRRLLKPTPEREPKPQQSFVDFIRESPLLQWDFGLTREQTPTRTFEL